MHIHIRPDAGVSGTRNTGLPASEGNPIDESSVCAWRLGGCARAGATYHGARSAARNRAGALVRILLDSSQAGIGIYRSLKRRKRSADLRHLWAATAWPWLMGGAFVFLLGAAGHSGGLNDGAITAIHHFDRERVEAFAKRQEPRRLATGRPAKPGKWLGDERPWSGAATSEPHRVVGLPLPATASLNTDVERRQLHPILYTTEEVRRRRAIRRVHGRRHSNSGGVSHGLYETQIWDAGDSTPRLATDHAAPMYHYNGGPSTASMAASRPKFSRDRPPGQWQSTTTGSRPHASTGRARRSPVPGSYRILHNGQVDFT